MKKMIFKIFMFVCVVIVFHSYPETYTSIINNITKMATTSTSVKINYLPGAGSGADYSVTVTPATKNYADNVAVLIKNYGVTNYTHDDVVKTIDSTSYSYDMILTGWKLVSVVQNGTTITTFEEPENYNYADTTNAKKDIGRIYSEEGYYVVPDGVTEVTFEAVYGWAIYIKDPYTSMVYDTNYWLNTTSSIASGRTGSADSNFGTNDTDDVVASLKRAYELITLAGETTDSYTMYDHVIVLLSDITDVRASQGSQPSTCYTDTYNDDTISTCNGTDNNWGYTTKDVAVTLTSDPKGTTRYSISVKAVSWGYYSYGDLRFDYVNWKTVAAVSGAVSKAAPIMYHGIGSYYNSFEATERFTSSYQLALTLSVTYQNIKLMGGSFTIRHTDHPFTGTHDYSVLKYILVGGTLSGLTYSNTATSELSLSKGTVNNPPVLCVTGGNINNIYLAGASSPSTVGFTRSDNTVYLYATGGRFGNILGSGASSLSGNAYIDLDGVTITGAIYAGGNNALSTITGDVTINLKNSTVANVYGGPQYGDILGASKINIKNTTVTGTVYGGGYGATSSTSTHITGQGNTTLTTVLSHLNSVSSCSDDGMTCYDTNGNVLTNIKKVGTQYRWYAVSAKSNEFIAGDMTDYVGFYDGTSRIKIRDYFNTGLSLATVVNNWTQIVASLSAATVNDVELTIEDSTVNGDVYAGGNRGSVNGNVKLTIKNSTIKGNVYGGGYTVSSNTVNIYYRNYSFENRPYGYLNTSGNMAYVGENVTYYVDGVSQGVNRYDTFTWRNYDYLLTNSDSWTSDDIANYEAIYGSGKASSANVKNGIDYANKVVYSETADKMGTVYGDVTVTIDNSTLSKNLYGGGYAGISEGNTTLNITNGSTVALNVYAGAYSSSVNGTGTVTVDSTSKISGDLYGGGYGATSTIVDSVVTVDGQVLGNIYGGSYAGKVTNSSTVNVTSNGVVSGSLYGGGLGEDSISKNAIIKISGVITKAVYGGSYAGSVTGTSTITVNNGGSVKTNIYGGGYGESSTLNNSIINMNGSALASVYGGSYAGKVLNKATITVGSTGIVTNNVFGAGEGATSNIVNTEVIIKGTVKKDVYGGSDLGMVGTGTIDGVNNTASITTAGSTTVSIESGANVLGNVYGAGNGAPEGESSMHIEYGALFGPSSVNITGGKVEGNVYGGGNRSRVFASSGNAVTMKINGENNTIEIGGAVFGGGNSAGDSGVNASVPTVIGNTFVQVTDNTSNDNIQILGGLYGGGNLCLVKGTKSIEINNFGTESEVAIKTLQRADSVVLSNSNIHIDSARDVVNEFDTSEYSINRIANLYFKNGSKVTINKTVNYLGSIISDNTSSSSVNNYLYINNGLLTNIEKEDNTYGKVEGYFYLGLINYTTGDGGGFLFANQDSTGGFINVDSSTSIVSDIFPDNYKFWYLDGVTYHIDLKVTGYTKAANSYIVELPLLPVYKKQFNLSVLSSSYSNTLETYITNNPYIDIVVGYKDKTVSAINLSSTKTLYNETTVDESVLPTLLLELNVTSLQLENTIEDETVTVNLSDGTNTYVINLEIDIVEQIIENSVFTNSGKWYNGISLSDSINVTNNSSYSVQFLTTYVPRLYSDIELTLETSSKFYEGTKIVMIDTTDENNTNYYYYIVTSDTSKIYLTEFKKMGTNNVYFEPYFSNRSINENFTFIIDMADSNTVSGTSKIMLGHYSNNIEILNNTASKEYKVSTSTHPNISSSLDNYGKDYYNFQLNITQNTDTTFVDTELTSDYILEVKHKDGSNFDRGSSIVIAGSTYYPVSGHNSILIPIDIGNYSVKYKTLDTSMGKDLLFNMYYGTNDLKSSSIISSYTFDVPDQIDYQFGILDTMDRIIEVDASEIIVPLTYSNLSNSTITVQLQEKVINSDGTYTYTTLKDYLTNDNSSGIKTVSLSNSITLGIDDDKLETMTTYNLLFTISDNKGYVFTDNVEFVVK